jgi:hypothetical protein
VTVEWKVSTTASIATLGAQAWVSGAAYGTELVTSAEPTVDTVQSFTVTGLTRAQLANGVLGVRVRASRANSNTAFTASLDAAGAVTATYRIDEFGIPTATTGTSTQPFAFTGDPVTRPASATSGPAPTTRAWGGYPEPTALRAP